MLQSYTPEFKKKIVRLHVGRAEPTSVQEQKGVRRCGRKKTVLGRKWQYGGC